jgi:hypothetical protein
MVYRGAEWNRVKRRCQSKRLFSITIETTWNNLVQVFNAPLRHHLARCPEGTSYYPVRQAGLSSSFCTCGRDPERLGNLQSRDFGRTKRCPVSGASQDAGGAPQGEHHVVFKRPRVRWASARSGARGRLHPWSATQSTVRGQNLLRQALRGAHPAFRNMPRAVRVWVATVKRDLRRFSGLRRPRRTTPQRGGGSAPREAARTRAPRIRPRHGAACVQVRPF